MRMAASAPRKNAVERDEKRSCPAVSYGRVSNGGTVEGSDGNEPRFVESQIHLAWSDGGVSW